MSASDIDDVKNRLLAKLQTAGAAGLTKSGLGIKSGTKAGKLGVRALTELEREGRIGNLGLRNRPRYVLRSYYRPLELAYEHVEARAEPGKPVLYTRTKLEKGLKGPMKAKLPEALDLLVKEGRLVRLKYGNATLYLHTASIAAPAPAQRKPGALPEPSPAQPSSTLDRHRLIEGYRRTVRRTFLPDVLISELRRELDLPLDMLHAALREASKTGTAILSLGDWTLASEEARAAALNLNGRPHLRVRLD